MKAKIGDKISLVQSKRAFFFQGDGGVNLGAGGNVTAIIPDTITGEMLNQIDIALGNGHLVFGSPGAKVAVPDRDSEIKKLLESGRNKVNGWVTKLMSDKTVKSQEKIRLIEKIIEFEQAGKNRKSVLISAESAARAIGGISAVTETDHEKIEIQLTSGNGEIDH